MYDVYVLYFCFNKIYVLLIVYSNVYFIFILFKLIRFHIGTFHGYPLTRVPDIKGLEQYENLVNPIYNFLFLLTRCMGPL